jgi:hypothetical protein
MMVGKRLHLMMMRRSGLRTLSLLVSRNLTMHLKATSVMTTVRRKMTHILVGGMIKQSLRVLVMKMTTLVTGLVAVVILTTLMR